MDNEIGEKGENLNLSQASRSMNIDPDEERIKIYDSYPASGNVIKYFCIFLLLGMVTFTIYLFYYGHWIWGILGILGTLALALITLIFGNATKEMAYKNGLIIPAIIINTNPIEILAMADMRSTEEQEPIFGFLKMLINDLPNHKLEINEKIPCVSLFGMAIKGYRRHFEPRPISWGYEDATLIPKIVDIISQEELTNVAFKNEWEMLYYVKNKLSKNLEYNTVVFYDDNLDEVEL